MAWLHPFLVELKGGGRAHSIVFRFGLANSHLHLPPQLAHLIICLAKAQQNNNNIHPAVSIDREGAKCI